MAGDHDRSSGEDGGAIDGSSLGKYVGLAALERAETQGEGEEEGIGGGGLSFGISSFHFRLLVESAGMSYEQIGRMTPDQIYHRLCNKDVLKMQRGHRTASADPAALEPDKDGFLKGRAEDGTVMKAKIRVGGKSLARRLAEEAEAKKTAR